jgi:acetolactate synthase-1/2/3 large subunit
MLGGLSEFNSAVRHGVDLVVIVCNDGSYGPEYESLVQLGIPPDIVEFDWPDLGPVADALGGQGITVRSKPDLEAACALIANHSAPVLVDLKLDPDKVPPTPR